jgi:8-oxo-dGTP pyrophosphatase MutT (NUDIX family)
MKLYLPVIECAIEHNDRFLVIQHPVEGYSGGMWSFPGGKLDTADEEHSFDVLRAAVKREIFEEVGLTLNDPLQYVFSSYFLGNHQTPIINSTFYCKLTGDAPNVKKNPAEIAAYTWMTSEEIFNTPNSASWLKEYIPIIETFKKNHR